MVGKKVPGGWGLPGWPLLQARRQRQIRYPKPLNEEEVGPVVLSKEVAGLEEGFPHLVSSPIGIGLEEAGYGSHGDHPVGFGELEGRHEPALFQEILRHIILRPEQDVLCLRGRAHEFPRGVGRQDIQEVGRIVEGGVGEEKAGIDYPDADTLAPEAGFMKGVEVELSDLGSSQPAALDADLHTGSADFVEIRRVKGKVMVVEETREGAPQAAALQRPGVEGRFPFPPRPQCPRVRGTPKNLPSRSPHPVLDALGSGLGCSDLRGEGGPDQPTSSHSE